MFRSNPDTFTCSSCGPWASQALSDLEAAERTPARLPWFAKGGDTRLTEAKGPFLEISGGNASGTNSREMVWLMEHGEFRQAWGPGWALPPPSGASPSYPPASAGGIPQVGLLLAHRWREGDAGSSGGVS